MGELEGIDEDVQFDWAGAEALAAKFRAVAVRVDAQIPRRLSDARHAREEWRGLYARKFGGRMKICTSDARALAERHALPAGSWRSTSRAPSYEHRPPFIALNGVGPVG